MQYTYDITGKDGSTHKLKFSIDPDLVCDFLIRGRHMEARFRKATRDGRAEGKRLGGGLKYVIRKV